MATNVSAEFLQVQLALTSVLANPSFGSVLTNFEARRSSMNEGDDLKELFASSGAPLPDNVKVSLGDITPDPLARWPKVQILICATLFDETEHCTTLTIQSPIEIG